MTRRIVFSRKGGGMWIEADWAQASSSIWVTNYKPGSDQENWHPTPFQVADSGHSPAKAATMVARWDRGQAW